MSLRRIWLGMALAGCSFSSFAGGHGSQGLGDDDDGSGATGVTPPPVEGSTSQGIADAEGGASGEGPGTTSGPAMPPTTLPPGDPTDAPPDTTGPPPTGSESGAVDDCSMPVAFKLSIDDAVVVEPMVTVDVENIGQVAYSEAWDDGEVDFTIDVTCPGPYYLHAFVAEFWGGVHGCCDPDSYDVFWPGGSGTWFYGCQTEEIGDGWHWLPIMSVPEGDGCADATVVELDLSEGENVITLHNREGANLAGNVAAVAQVVVTNDPAYEM